MIKPFIISREFDAPRERVWQAWTEVERLKQWFSPKGFTVIAAKMNKYSIIHLVSGRAGRRPSLLTAPHAAVSQQSARTALFERWACAIRCNLRLPQVAGLFSGEATLRPRFQGLIPLSLYPSHCS